MIRRAMGILILSMFFAFPASAGNVYVELDAGPSFVSDSDLGSGVEAEFDPGFNVGAAVGFRFLKFFRTEINTSYRQAEVDNVSGPGFSLDGAGDAGVFAAMTNAYFDLDLGAPVVPYVGAGVGVGVVIVDSDSTANILVIDDSTAEFAWNVMGGLSFRVTDHFILSGGYRYFATTDATLEATVVGFGSGTLDAEVGVHEAVVGARFEF